jgi:hypothetical protein
VSDDRSSNEEQEAQRLREDWTARIGEAAGDPVALHDVAVAWSETAGQVCASLLEATGRELRARDQMLERLWQERREMASLTNAGDRRGGPTILRRTHRKRLQAANAQRQGSYREAYAILEQARQGSLQSAVEWPAHLERWEAQGHDLLVRLGTKDPDVSEALDALQSAHRRFVEALETLSEPISEELRPE